MGNEISSDASNNVKYKIGQMTPKELRNRRKMAEQYIQIINTELGSRRDKRQLTYQPKSKTGNSKTSNKLVVSKNKKRSKPLEKKSKSGGKKSTTSSQKKTVRKHRGIYQDGNKKGKLKPGFRYTGKKMKSGIPEIKET